MDNGENARMHETNMYVKWDAHDDMEKCNTHEAFSVPRLTVGVSNEVEMARNLTGGLPVVNQGRMTSLGPIRKRLTLAHEKR